MDRVIAVLVIIAGTFMDGLPTSDLHMSSYKMHKINIAPSMCNHFAFNLIYIKKSKSIAVTGRGVPYGCETSRFQHFIQNRLTDGITVVCPTFRPPFIHRKTPGIQFC
jgi:hypothetical protein